MVVRSGLEVTVWCDGGTLASEVQGRTHSPNRGKLRHNCQQIQFQAPLTLHRPSELL